MWQSLIYVAVGSSLGGVSRHLVARALAGAVFPYSTLAVNAMGCLLMGVLFGLAQRIGWKEELWLLLATGFCGSFTTFSTFVMDDVKLFHGAGSELAMYYLFGSLILGFSAFCAGQALAR